MACTRTYRRDRCFSESGANIARADFPRFADCAAPPRSEVSDAWNCNLCPGDQPYFAPVAQGDKIVIQTRFPDTQNGVSADCEGLEEGQVRQVIRVRYTGSDFQADAQPPLPQPDGGGNTNATFIGRPEIAGTCGAQGAGSSTPSRFSWSPSQPAINSLDEFMRQYYIPAINDFNPCSSGQSGGGPAEGAGGAWTWITDNPNEGRLVFEGTLAGVSAALTCAECEAEDPCECNFGGASALFPCDDLYTICFFYGRFINTGNPTTVAVNGQVSVPNFTAETLEIQCCCAQDDCIGYSPTASCDVAEGFAEFRFRIQDAGLIFGAVNQEAAMVQDFSIWLARVTEDCPLPSVTLDPRLYASNATDYNDYMARVADYYQNNLLGASTAVWNPATQELVINFDLEAYQTIQEQDVCDWQLQVCVINYDGDASPAECQPTEPIEYAWTFQEVIPPQGQNGTLRIENQSCGVFIDFANIGSDNLAIDLSYALSPSAVPGVTGQVFAPHGQTGNFVQASGLRLFIDPAQYPEICDCAGDEWVAQHTDGSRWNLYFYDRAICCDAACEDNENGYFSGDLLIDTQQLSPQSDTIAELQLFCGNAEDGVAEAGALGFLSYTVAPAANANDWITNLMTVLNGPNGLPSGLYAMRFGNVIRIKTPYTALAQACDCAENLIWYISITGGRQ